MKSAEESGATVLLLKKKIRKKTNKKIKKKINKKKSKIREVMTKITIKIKMENLVVEVVIYKSVDVLTTSCSLGALKLIKFRVLGVIWTKIIVVSVPELGAQETIPKVKVKKKIKK